MAGSGFDVGFQAHSLIGDTLEITEPQKQKEIKVSLLVNQFTTQERIDIINSTISTEKSFVIDDSYMHKGPTGMSSTYYLGWNEALKSLKMPNIPSLSFELTLSDNNDITIELTNLPHKDGYSGFTTNNNKSNITIYQVSQLSKSGLETIIRHEMGHALGLGHTTAPEDLMYPEIPTDFPYISPCDLDGIKELYKNQTHTNINCSK